jgi:hypothetical protein
MKQCAEKNIFYDKIKDRVIPVCRRDVTENAAINLLRRCMMVSSQLHIEAALAQVKLPRCAFNRRASEPSGRSKYYGEVEMFCCSP